MNPEGQNEDPLLSEVKSELGQIDEVELHEVSARYENLHAKLNEALSSIEGM